IKRLGVDVRHIEIPKDLFTAIKNGGYETDEAIKAQMVEWVEQIWHQKDQLITEMLADFESNDFESSDFESNNSGNRDSEIKDNIEQA
ncbi:hypothetical protein SB861_61885, partial [Paraburkholderia sp. SIMBA_049]